METVYGVYMEIYVGKPVLLTPLYSTEEKAEKAIVIMIESLSDPQSRYYTIKEINIL